ncbi:UrcA family protein [Sphingomonas hankookensis]|uniref:UrcA family protein n=1 Tax=Sphingomonas hankookensis TaxID=563996 RepID=UPI001F565179|nr:UrcA family protein [Sphingomonas hankookensis]
MTIRFIALAASAAACLSSVAHAEEREPVSVRVSYAGLNLASVEGRRILDARIDRAALHACQSRIMGLRRLNDERRCRNEMRSDAQVRMAQLTPVAVASAR